jgi:flagellar assembly protein FliH
MIDPTHVIKEDDQRGVAPAALGDALSSATTHRIPADRTSVRGEAPPQASPPQVEPGHILRGDETQDTAHPVSIDAEAFGEEDPTNETASETAASDGEPDSSSSPSEPSEDQPSRTDAEWQARLDEAVKAAREEGYEEGHDAGYQAGYDEAETAVRAEAHAKRDALVDDATRLNDVWTQYVEEQEPMLIELALELAEVIVDAPLTASLRRPAEDALAEAVAELSTTPPVSVRLHPSDYERLQESGLADRMAVPDDALNWTPDPDCARGDWSVSSSAGVIRRLRQDVVESLRRRLGMDVSSASPS